MHQTASVTVVPTSRPRAAGIRNPTGARIRARTGGVPSAPVEIEDQTQVVKKNSKKAATDTILDRIETEIDQQGKCIEDLSRKLRFHLEQVCEVYTHGILSWPNALYCRLVKPLFIISETRGISFG